MTNDSEEPDDPDDSNESDDSDDTDDSDEFDGKHQKWINFRHSYYTHERELATTFTTLCALYHKPISVRIGAIISWQQISLDTYGKGPKR